MELTAQVMLVVEQAHSNNSGTRVSRGMMIQPSIIFARFWHYLFGATAIAGLLSCSRANSVESRAEHPDATIVEERSIATEIVGPVQISIDEPTPSEPVKAVMEIRPDVAVPGSVIEVLVKVRIARAHYLHAENGSDKTFTPVAIKSELPEGLEPISDWQLSEPTKIHGALVGYLDSILLKRTLNILPNARQQSVVFTADLQYQACTDEMCWPPANIKLSASLVIGSSPR
jgi:hypothetical protein